MTPTAMLELLHGWRDAGWLRRLDLAFAEFIHKLDPGAPASLLLASALLAQLEGRGHSGLPLKALMLEPDALLGWPAESGEDLEAALADCPADASALRAAWSARPVMQVDPSDESGSSPLVLCGDLLYLRRYWRYESRVALQIRSRTRRVHSVGNSPSAVDAVAARNLLDQLFPPQVPPSTDWQKVACALALRGRLTLITGGPGTGKTYTAARLLVLLQALHSGPQPLRVALAAPTGKAAARLRQSIDIALHDLRQQLGTSLPLDEWAAQLAPARTLHSLLGGRPGTRRFRHDAANPLEVDVLFVDESSMVHLEMMASLLEAMPVGARVVLLGDKDQLASVEAGAVMGDLCEGGDPMEATRAPTGYRPDNAQWVHDVAGQSLSDAVLGDGADLAQQTVVLRESRRFAVPIGQLALAVNRGDGVAAIDLLRSCPDGDVTLIEARDASVIPPVTIGGRPGAPGGYRAYLETLGQRPVDAAGFDGWAKAVLRKFDGFRVLCAVREGPWGVAGLNEAIERALAEQGLLQRRAEWYEGRPVMVTRNDASLGVFNGDIGIVLRSPAAEGSLRCYFLDGEELRSVSVGRLADVVTAFAMTVHKSQGSEFDHVLLVFPDEDVPVLTRELVYTGITRARRAFTLVTRHAGSLVAAASRQTRRVSGLRTMLDRDT